MKYKMILAACTALLPTMVSGQGLEVKDCRTLADAGNFLGPDEVMADGLVCKIGKPKPVATSSATETTKKDSDPRAKLALLGIVDTKSQQPEAKANPVAAATTPETSPKSALVGAAVSEGRTTPQDAAIGVEHGPSLADVARAYQKSSRPQTAKKPEEPVVAEAPTETPEVMGKADSTAALPSTPVVPAPKTKITVRASAVAPTTVMGSKAEGSPAPSASATPAAAEAQSPAKSAAVDAQPPLEVKLESAPATETSAGPGMPEAKPVAKTATVEAQPPLEVKLESAPTASAPAKPAVEEAQPVAKTPATEAEPSAEAKPEPSLEAATPATPPTGASQPEMKTGSFDGQQGPRNDERPEVRAAMPEPEAESNSDRPQEVKLGVFAPPREVTVETKPQAHDPFGALPEDVAIQEPRPGCAKIVSLGSLEKDRLVLATPDWAMKWLEKNQKRFPGVCFADSPMAGVPNFLIVFFTAEPPASPADLAAETSTPSSTSSGSSGGTFTTSFGSTWHYTYDNAATTTVTTAWTENVSHNQQAQALYATAYTEQGIPISQHWPEPAKGHEKETKGSHGRKNEVIPEAVRIMSDLLGEMMMDLAAH
jgi:hypothetical protein